MLSMFVILLLLPATVSLTMLVSSSLMTLGFHAAQNYEVDYKYWLSFIGQLLGLIFFVVSFLLVFIMGANLIAQ